MPRNDPEHSADFPIKPPVGRPRKKLDRELVKKLAEAQLTTAEIASICKCSSDTIERRFSELLKHGRAVGTGSVKRELYKTAMGNGRSKSAAMIFYLKAHAGLTDRLTITGPNGGPLQFKDMTDGQLSDYIREKLAALGIDTPGEHDAGTGKGATGARTTGSEG